MFDESSVRATEHALVWGLENVGDGDSSHRRPAFRTRWAKTLQRRNLLKMKCIRNTTTILHDKTVAHNP